MRPLGAPMIIEEDVQYSLRTNDDGGWSNTDCVSDRHVTSGNTGSGAMGYVDGSVGRVQLPPQKSGAPGSYANPAYFNANSLCLRVGRRWVSGRSWLGTCYGYLSNPPPPPAGMSH
jgi:hypothetical protein